MKTLKPRFILVEPRNPNNIGAVARAMANFDFDDLVVVNPYQPVWKETVAAVNAEHVMTKAKKVTTLDDATATSHVVIGTSTGKARTLGPKWIEPNDLQKIIQTAVKKSEKVSIVFGSEKNGLSNDDLLGCNYILKLPTSEKVPSMNLSHATALVSYLINEPYRPKPLRERKKFKKVASKNLHRLVLNGSDALKKTKLFPGWSETKTKKELKRAFYQWNLDSVDVSMLNRIFRWMTKKTQNGDRHGK